ncbi:MAG: hypothetical protein ACFFC6_17450 [Promethearchaeota archaeon]
MNRKTRLHILCLSILLLISVDTSSARSNEQKLEWNVYVGDNETFIVEKYFDDTDSDGDGNKKTQTLEITDERGKETEVTTQNGSTIKVKIIALNKDAQIKLTYNDKVTSQTQVDSDPVSPFVTKTIYNQSYWEEWAEGKEEYSVIGHLLIRSVKSTVAGITTEVTIKRNWKDGWLIYFYRRTYNTTATISEMELIRGAPNAPELTWQVKVGDSQTYTITEFYDQSDSDKDGNPHSSRGEIETETDELINVTVTKGSTVKVEIVELGFVAVIRYTYEEEVRTKAHDDDGWGLGYLMKTIDDQSYWEDWARFKPDYFVEGPYLVLRMSDQEEEGVTWEQVRKRDWKTGWMMYQSWKVYNESSLLTQYEVCAEAYEPVSSWPITTSNRTYHAPIPMMVMSIIMIVFWKRKL